MVKKFKYCATDFFIEKLTFQTSQLRKFYTSFS